VIVFSTPNDHEPFLPSMHHFFSPCVIPFPRGPVCRSRAFDDVPSTALYEFSFFTLDPPPFLQPKQFPWKKFRFFLTGLSKFSILGLYKSLPLITPSFLLLSRRAFPPSFVIVAFFKFLEESVPFPPVRARFFPDFPPLYIILLSNIQMLTKEREPFQTTLEPLPHLCSPRVLPPQHETEKLFRHTPSNSKSFFFDLCFLLSVFPLQVRLK